MYSMKKMLIILFSALLFNSCHNTEYRFYQTLEGKDWNQTIDNFVFEVHIGSGIIGQLHAPDTYAVNIHVSRGNVPLNLDSNNIFDSLKIDSFCISFFGSNFPQCPDKIYQKYFSGQMYKRVKIPISCDSIDVSFAAIFLADNKESRRQRFRRTLYRKTEHNSYYFE
jgi:hypothetical protein